MSDLTPAQLALVQQEAQTIIKECGEPYAHRYSPSEDWSIPYSKKQRKRDIDFWVGFFQGPHYYVQRRNFDLTYDSEWSTTPEYYVKVNITADYDEFMRFRNTPGWRSHPREYSDPTEFGVYNVDTKFHAICDALKDNLGSPGDFYMSTAIDNCIKNEEVNYYQSPYAGCRPSALFKAFFDALSPYGSAAKIKKRETDRESYYKTHAGEIKQTKKEKSEEDVSRLRYNMKIRKDFIDEYQGEIEEHESAIRMLKRKIDQECDIYDSLSKQLERAEGDNQIN